MNCISYCFSDRIFNEDTFSFSDHHIMVLDGATSLTKKNIMSEDDAAWFVQQLKKEIDKHILEEQSLSTIVYNACMKIKSQYYYTQDIDYPNACISLFRFQEDTLEYFGLGDSLGIVEMKDGSIECFEDKMINELDNNVIEHMITLSKEKQIPFLETRQEQEIKDHLLQNRKCHNQSYFILDPTGKGIRHACIKQWKLEEISRICCMSDGFSQIMMYPGFSDIIDVLNEIDRDHGKIEKQLYFFQEQDPDCIYYPRLKKRDDTTYVYLKF
ncbi:protein phosphatase 2C domain-containing protein [Floccifex sp.]|uniref:protein phosphatase 2C domain-containing protein n=1 Tax=Floccifex sp. TaxID=2815810 RepID=UPI003F0078DA